jgi:hypothetical protein
VNKQVWERRLSHGVAGWGLGGDVVSCAAGDSDVETAVMQLKLLGS